MEYSRIEILPSVWLSHLREDKFKTASFSVNLLTQLSQETASLNALIPYVLRRGTASCPDMEAIGARLDDLYGSSIEPIVRKIGEIQCVGFYANFPEDELLPAGSQVRKSMISFCAEMLLSPMTRGGLLLPAYVESEREKLAELLAARINNKRAWAVVRCIEEMFRFEAFSVSRFGTEEDCRSVHYTKLSRHYRQLLQTCPIELFYCGRASLRELESLLRTAFATLPRGEINDEIGTDIRMNAIEAEPRVTEEEMAVSQMNLVIGWRLGSCMEDPDLAALYVFNALFGGSPSSRLFQNVREKLSLCYYASSMVDVRKGYLLMSAGIEPDNLEAAQNEIFTQLEDLKNGNISDEELASAIAGVVSDLHSAEDSQDAMENFILANALSGLDCMPMELAELCKEVTKEQIAVIAGGVECDQIYVLRPQDEEDEEPEEEDEDAAED